MEVLLEQKPVKPGSPEYEHVLAIYEEAFPPEERYPVEMLDQLAAECAQVEYVAFFDVQDATGDDVPGGGAEPCGFAHCDAEPDGLAGDGAEAGESASRNAEAGNLTGAEADGLDDGNAEPDDPAGGGAEPCESAYCDAEPCGFAFNVIAGEFVYVVYLAVNAHVRSNGYGSRMLAQIRKAHAGRTAVLEIEPMLEDAPNYAQRVRRLAFYERNGFSRADYVLREDEMDYEVLVAPPIAADASGMDASSFDPWVFARAISEATGGKISMEIIPCSS